MLLRTLAGGRKIIQACHQFLIAQLIRVIARIRTGAEWVLRHFDRVHVGGVGDERLGVSGFNNQGFNGRGRRALGFDNLKPLPRVQPHDLRARVIERKLYALALRVDAG
jgi:hypothetical protein